MLEKKSGENQGEFHYLTGKSPGDSFTVEMINGWVVTPDRTVLSNGWVIFACLSRLSCWEPWLFDTDELVTAETDLIQDKILDSLALFMRPLSVTVLCSSARFLPTYASVSNLHSNEKFLTITCPPLANCFVNLWRIKMDTDIERKESISSETKISNKSKSWFHLKSVSQLGTLTFKTEFHCIPTFNFGDQVEKCTPKATTHTYRKKDLSFQMQLY